jgi:cellulose biosynthesis protein BcsE
MGDAGRNFAYAQMTVAQTYFSIGIAGLPAPARSMTPGQVYAINSDLAQPAAASFAGSLAEALRGLLTAIAVIRTPVGELLQRLALHGVDVQDALDHGRLIILRQSNDYGAKLLRYGARHFTDELDYYGVPPKSLLAIENAEALFTLDDPRLAENQARIYQQWCKSACVTALLLFAAPVASTPQATTLRNLSDLFAGMVEFSRIGMKLVWTIKHWQSPFASLSQREYVVGLDEQGEQLLTEGHSIEGLDKKIKYAPDQDRVIATEAAVRGERGVPSHWRIVPDLDVLLETAKDSIAATCLIDFAGGDNLRLIARTVHTLRRQCGRGLRIVVRERNLRLRYSDELLLLRLGANTVVYAEVSFSRFITLVNSLRDEAYAGTVPDDFESAVQAAMPPQHVGYIAPSVFCDMVRECLAQSAHIGVESALICLYLLPEATHIDTLRAFKIKRLGDLFTADERSVWLFLYSCREPDVDATLERLYAEPLAHAFEGQVRYFSSSAIQSAIDDMESRLYVAPIADFTAQLESIPATPADARTRTSAAGEPVPVALKIGKPLQMQHAAHHRNVTRTHLHLSNQGRSQ